MVVGGRKWWSKPQSEPHQYSSTQTLYAFLRVGLVKEKYHLFALFPRGSKRDDINTVGLLGLSIKEQADMTHDHSPAEF
jgi:hypothetical protein